VQSANKAVGAHVCIEQEAGEMHPVQKLRDRHSSLYIEPLRLNWPLCAVLTVNVLSEQAERYSNRTAAVHGTAVYFK